MSTTDFPVTEFETVTYNTLGNFVSELVVFDCEECDSPWDKQDFRDHLRSPNHMAVVLIQDSRIRGFGVYSRKENRSFEILKLTVVKGNKWRSLGAQLIDFIADRAKDQGANQIEMRITNDPDSEDFVRRQGFITPSQDHSQFVRWLPQ